MNTPTLQEIDAIRKEGMRPQVVGCFVSNKKTLLVYSEKYNLWQFPQGGIDNTDTTFYSPLENSVRWNPSIGFVLFFFSSLIDFTYRNKD